MHPGPCWPVSCPVNPGFHGQCRYTASAAATGYPGFLFAPRDTFTGATDAAANVSAGLPGFSASQGNAVAVHCIDDKSYSPFVL